MPEDLSTLPRVEYAFPGPLRDALVAAILDGTKTTTSSLRSEYGDEPLARPGARELLVDSGERPVAVLETTDVRVVALGDVDLAHAIGEGEGYPTVAAWRAGHERFWTSPEYVELYGEVELNDASAVVCETIRVVRRLRP